MCSVRAAARGAKLGVHLQTHVVPPKGGGLHYVLLATVMCVQRARRTLRQAMHVATYLTAAVLNAHAGGYASLADAVDAWYNEVKLYDFNNPGWNTATGHFTALVWKSTTKLGCAINAACSSWTTYVCQYGPPGNVIGVDWSQEVKAKAPAPARPSLPTPAPAPSKPVPVKPSQALPAPAQPKPSAVQPAPAKPSPAAQPPKPQKPARKPAVKQPQLTADQRTALDKHNS